MTKTDTTARPTRTSAARLALARAVPPAGPVRGLTLSTFLTTLGDGLFATVSVLFFTRVVGLRMVDVGIGLTVASLAGLLAALPIGHLSDRIGPRRVLLVLTVAAGPAVLCYLVVGSFWPFAATACAVGVVQRGCRTVLPALVSLIASAEERVTARAHQQVVSNIGISLGAGAAGLALYLDTRAAYEAMVVVAALAYAGSALVLNRMPVRHPPPAHSEKQPLGAALKDLRYLRFTGLNAVLSLNGALMEIAIPLWLVTHTKAPAWLFSALIVLNTILVVVFQVQVSSKGNDTTPGLWGRISRLGGFFLGCACLLYGAAGWGNTLVATAVLGLGMIAHTWGEMYQVSGEWGLSFQLAPEHATGQYQGVLAIGRGAANVAAPVALVAVVGAGQYGWVALAAVFLAAGLAMPAATRLPAGKDPVSDA
ncbi:MFS transporter [Kitasatospora sp. NPDC127121]|uniref:MFS transporter n=1 Tax=Kitasatospora sp. NPDC127121 TaxID=3345371 RepID=UPI003638D97E